MTFDDSEESDSSDSTATDTPSEPTVDVEWESEPVPVSTAIEVHDEMLTSDMADSHAVSERVTALQEQINQQHEQITELYTGISLMLSQFRQAGVLNENASIEWDHEP